METAALGRDQRFMDAQMGRLTSTVKDLRDQLSARTCFCSLVLVVEDPYYSYYATSTVSSATMRLPLYHRLQFLVIPNSALNRDGNIRFLFVASR